MAKDAGFIGLIRIQAQSTALSPLKLHLISRLCFQGKPVFKNATSHSAT
jgi:hypothetical protein